MKSVIIMALALSAATAAAQAQTFPLPVDRSLSAEALMAKDRVLESCEVGGFRMVVPIETGKRAKGSPDDPDYAIFGTVSHDIDLSGKDMSQYDRLVADIMPTCEGQGVMNLNLSIDNDPASGLGAHLITLDNNRWNTMRFDISGLRRDHVRRLRFYTDQKGRNLFLGKNLTYVVKNLRFEKTSARHPDRGWATAPGDIAYSMSGYLTDGEKTALLGFDAPTFRLVDTATGKVAFGSGTRTVSNALGTFRVADFSAFRKPGTYRLECGTRGTRPFTIGADAFRPSMWKVLNFIYCQRCGVAVDGIHGRCHNDVYSVRDGHKVSYGGGWHDAGDLSQQTLQTADAAFALTEAYAHERKADTALAKRLKAEAEHGFSFVLRQRLGEGWHASSIGLLHWTDGKPGTDDDITTVRTQDCAFDNFLYAGYEAFAAMSLDSRMADKLRQAAIEDYAHARQRFARHGYDNFPHMMEHTYNTSRSLFRAVMSWAASQMFRLTGDKRYASDAAASARYLLRCQATGAKSPLLNGYFYRDTTKAVPVHFIHQSRDQMFAMALVELCKTQPHGADFAAWREALTLYADHLKALMPYTSPYNMVPSGIWQGHEYDDADGFDRLHLFAPNNARELYDKQFCLGERIDDNHRLRRFPIWFSIFNGNEAILLSTAKAAATMGNYLHDERLSQIGRDQLYWTVGHNPLAQSLIYGEGHNYPSLDSFSSGEITGAMPVGIRAQADADAPYWPSTNNACYKEVWVTTAGKWLSLLAEY